MKNFLLIISLIFTASCVETVAVGSLATGTIVVREKSIEDTKNDIIISTEIGSQLLANGLKNPGNSIDVTVNEGRVLLTGLVRDSDKAALAVDIAWRVKGVKEVIDEVQLADDKKLRPRDFTSASKDYFITWQIETKLLFAKRITSVNYQVTTVAGVVYLFGVSDSDAEMQKVLAIVSKVKGVKKVVNHVILVSDARRK
jgi:osmotically-inducible protein OsmY